MTKETLTHGLIQRGNLMTDSLADFRKNLAYNLRCLDGANQHNDKQDIAHYQKKIETLNGEINKRLDLIPTNVYQSDGMNRHFNPIGLSRLIWKAFNQCFNGSPIFHYEVLETAFIERSEAIKILVAEIHDATGKEAYFDHDEPAQSFYVGVLASALDAVVNYRETF